MPVDAFNYEEGVDGSDHSKYLWGNAAYALARAVDQRVRAVRHGARRFAAWKAAGWWKGCRRTTSPPTTATSR